MYTGFQLARYYCCLGSPLKESLFLLSTVLKQQSYLVDSSKMFGFFFLLLLFVFNSQLLVAGSTQELISEVLACDLAQGPGSETLVSLGILQSLLEAIVLADLLEHFGV